MERMPDEIKKGLECDDCKSCPYGERNNNDGDNHCGEVEGDALALIQQLEAELEDMTTRYKIADDCAKKKGEMNEKLYAELTAVKAERDAAVEDLQMGVCCGTCAYDDTDVNDQPCATCARATTFGNWEWRGVRKEDGNA